MTDLHESIRSAIARTRTERELPANVLAAIESAGYVVIERSRWERVSRLCKEHLEAAPAGGAWLKPGDLDGVRGLHDLDPSAEGSTDTQDSVHPKLT
jgi:hypothetical protein